MVGRGQSHERRRHASLSQNCEVFRRGEWVEAHHPLQDAEDPVFSMKADRLGGVGPGLAFGQEMSEKVGEPVGLLLCAKGGHGIGAWARDRVLYRTMRERLDAASVARSLAGVLVYVGEGDTRSTEAAEAWKDSFVGLVEDLRTDSGDPSLPIVFAQIATITAVRRARRAHRFAGWERLKEVQARISLPHVTMVVTDDLPLEPDGLHLSADAADTLGIRFADAMSKLLEERSVVSVS